MHVRVSAALAPILVTACSLMAGCAHKPPPEPVAAAAPDPYGYLPRSAVCTVSPVSGGRVTMSTRSDDGLCAVAVATPDGTAYASFLLQTAPAHGKAFIHNYNNQTLIDYTATTAYAGPDSFTVSLIPVSGPRVPLLVVASVDATGVARPAPPPPDAAPPPAGTTHKKVVRKRKKTTKATS